MCLESQKRIVLSFTPSLDQKREMRKRIKSI